MKLRGSLATRVAVIYVLIVGCLITTTWLRTKPEYHGFDWFWAGVLTAPGFGVLLVLPQSVLVRIPEGIGCLVGLAVNGTAI